MKEAWCSWESPFANRVSSAPGGDYLSREIVDRRERPRWILRSWVSPPADGSRSLERYHACRPGATGLLPTDLDAAVPQLRPDRSGFGELRVNPMLGGDVPVVQAEM